MYHTGKLIVYGSDGVCRVEAVGPLSLRGVRRDVDYYTLRPLYQSGLIYAPVDTGTCTRPVMTRDEALALIVKIPEIPAEALETTDPRLLGAQYK